MTSKKQTFKNQFQQELDNVKLNVQKIDARIPFRTQQVINETRAELKRIDERLAEIHPEWCEVWRLKRRKDKAERKLKHYSSY